MSELERPPLKHQVQLDDGDTKSIHLTYGLWNDFQRVMPDATVVVEGGLTDPFLRDYLVRRCFTETSKMIEKEEDLIGVDKMPVSDPVEIEKLLSWITAHLLYFFGASASSLRSLGQKFQSTIQTTPAAPSADGSEA